jgi:hypothetical protein
MTRAMKQTLLTASLLPCCGACVAALLLQPVTVPYYEWLPLGSDALKQAYLRNMLGLPGAQPGGP